MSRIDKMIEDLGFRPPVTEGESRIDTMSKQLGYGTAERVASIAVSQDYFKENWRIVGSERIKQAQDRRRQADAEPLNAREQIAIMDAYRMAAGEKPVLAGRDYYREAQYAARQGDSFYTRWLANSSAAIQAATSPALNIVGVFDPELANDLQRDTVAQYGSDIQQGTFVGRTVGGALGMAPAMLATPAAAPAFFGLSGLGGTRREVSLKRQQGAQISTAAEWSSAVAIGVVNAGIARLTHAITGKMAKVLSGHSALLATALQTGGKKAMHRTALGLLKSNLPETLWRTAQGSITIATMTGLDNAIAKAGYDPDRSVLEGVGESAIVGGLFTLGASAVRIARMMESLPAERIVDGITKEAARSELKGQSLQRPIPVSKAKPTIVPKILDALKKAKKITRIVTAEQKIERGKRVGKAEALLKRGLKEGAAEEALQKSKAALKGPLTKYDARYESIRKQFKSSEIDTLFKDITKNPRLRYFERLNTQEALTKLLDGHAIQRHEVILLRNQFGGDVAKIAMRRRPMSDRVWDTSLDVLGLPRTMLASLDMSGIWRQARLLGQVHPREYAQMIKKYHQTFFSKKHTDRVNKEMKQSPDYDEAQRMGLSLTKFGSQATSIFEREERFASRFAAKIPGIKQSERSYTTALNWMRLSVYSKLRHGLVQTGRPVTETSLKRISAVINDLSGRSNLGKNIQTKRIAGLLNALFFAPRFTLSRLNVPAKMASRDPNVRRQASLALASFVGTNLAAMGLVKMIWGDKMQIELDPRSSEFGKMKFGNVRIDPWAGYVPLVRFAAQMATGQRKTSGTNELRDISRKRVMSRFIRSKESPIAGLITDVYTGKKFSGKELNWTEFNLENEFYQRLTPLSIQDFLDASVNDGVATGLAVFPLAWYGMGVQDYKPSPYSELAMLRFEKAREEFNKDYTELTEREQKKLLQDKEIQQAERKAKASKTDYDFVADLINREHEVGRKVEKKLPDDIRLELIRAGVSLGSVKRTWGRWTLNDKRYDRFQQLINEEVTRLLRPRIRMRDWDRLSEEDKISLLNRLVTAAKKRARRRLRQEVSSP
ncbi:hypothetical protein KAR91_56620 [Candidatus Pacearchaeota archaeon]|nr:hypothetical protein [Candidatus Pacearchaeota archaeon]